MQKVTGYTSTAVTLNSSLNTNASGVFTSTILKATSNNTYQQARTTGVTALSTDGFWWSKLSLTIGDSDVTRPNSLKVMFCIRYLVETTDYSGRIDSINGEVI